MIGRSRGYIHPKTLIEIICLDPVSANSQKCIGSQWAVIRVGQRLQSRFGKSGAAPKLGLVQIIVEASSIRGGFRDTCPCQLVSGWHCRCVWRDYREWLIIRTAGCKLYILETMTCSWHSRNYSTPFGWAATFSGPLMSLWPARDMSLGRWLLVACFSSLINHNVSGPHHFPSFTTQPKKSLGWSYSEQKNHFAIGRNSERCSYHTDLSRFVLPISDPSASN